MIKRIPAWGVTYTNSPEVAVYSLRRTRREAIAEWVGKDPSDWDWARWKKLGCRTVKVTVVQEIKK